MYTRNDSPLKSSCDDSDDLREKEGAKLTRSETRNTAHGGSSRYLSDVGMDVNAPPWKRSPRAATFPIVAVKSTEPNAPAMLARPGMSLSTSAVLALGARGIVPVPRIFPWLSRAVAVIVLFTDAKLTTATPVTYFGLLSQKCG